MDLLIAIAEVELRKAIRSGDPIFIRGRRYLLERLIARKETETT